MMTAPASAVHMPIEPMRIVGTYQDDALGLTAALEDVVYGIEVLVRLGSAEILTRTSIDKLHDWVELVSASEAPLALRTEAEKLARRHGRDQLYLPELTAVLHSKREIRDQLIVELLTVFEALERTRLELDAARDRTRLGRLRPRAVLSAAENGSDAITARIQDVEATIIMVCARATEDLFLPW